MLKTPHARTTFGRPDVWKSKVSKTTCFEPFFPGQFFNVQMWEKCTPLLREAHFEVKMLKTQHARTTTLDYTPLHYTTLRYTTLQYTTLRYTTV